MARQRIDENQFVAGPGEQVSIIDRFGIFGDQKSSQHFSKAPSLNILFQNSIKSIDLRSRQENNFIERFDQIRRTENRAFKQNHLRRLDVYGLTLFPRHPVVRRLQDNARSGHQRAQILTNRRPIPPVELVRRVLIIHNRSRLFSIKKCLPFDRVANKSEVCRIERESVTCGEHLSDIRFPRPCRPRYPEHAGAIPLENRGDKRVALCLIYHTRQPTNLCPWSFRMMLSRLRLFSRYDNWTVSV